jgi:hypothetical protein
MPLLMFAALTRRCPLLLFSDAAFTPIDAMLLMPTPDAMLPLILPARPRVDITRQLILLDAMLATLA